MTTQNVKSKSQFCLSRTHKRSVQCVCMCASIPLHTLQKSDFALGGIFCSRILEHTHTHKYAAISFESTQEQCIKTQHFLLQVNSRDKRLTSAFVLQEAEFIGRHTDSHFCSYSFSPFKISFYFSLMQFYINFNGVPSPSRRASVRNLSRN